MKYYNAFERNNFKWNPPVVDLKVKLWTDDAEPLVARDCGALNLCFRRFLSKQLSYKEQNNSVATFM